jgi:hypothetical protein
VPPVLSAPEFGERSLATRRFARQAYSRGVRLDRRAYSCIALAAASLLGCGARTGFEDASAGSEPPRDAGIPSDGPAPFDAPPAEASVCTPAPPGGVTIATLPTTVISMALAVAGDSVYAGTAAISSSSPLYTGAVDRLPASGGAMQALAAPGYNFGNIVSDGARLYYPQTSGSPQGPDGAVYTVLGLAAIDLATGAVHPIKTPAPPWSTSSNLNSDMMAATTAWPGVFWIGGTAGSDGASTLSGWDARTDTVTVLGTGQTLGGLAVDAAGVYWADVGGNQGITVYATPLGGGATTTLVNVPGGTHGVLLGVSATDVVFVTAHSGDRERQDRAIVSARIGDRDHRSERSDVSWWRCGSGSVSSRLSFGTVPSA